MTKALSKAILQRKSFRNKFLKNMTQTVENKHLYTRQRNLSLLHLRKYGKTYFASLNKKDITDR